MARISENERQFIIDGIEANVRDDGRGRTDFRPISVETGVILQAASSARVKLGDTEVLVGVKVDIGQPTATELTRDGFMLCGMFSSASTISIDEQWMS